MEVFDENRLTRDDFLGMVELPLIGIPREHADVNIPRNKYYILRPRRQVHQSYNWKLAEKIMISFGNLVLGLKSKVICNFITHLFLIPMNQLKKAPPKIFHPLLKYSNFQYFSFNF